MSNPPQPHLGVGLSPEECHEALSLTGGVPTALKLAAIATVCWYGTWFVFSIDVSVWAGFVIFGIAFALGYALARLLLHRAIIDEIRRRGELVRLRERLNSNINPTGERRIECP